MVARRPFFERGTHPYPRHDPPQQLQSSEGKQDQCSQCCLGGGTVIVEKITKKHLPASNKKIRNSDKERLWSYNSIEEGRMKKPGWSRFERIKRGLKKRTSTCRSRILGSRNKARLYHCLVERRSVTGPRRSIRTSSLVGLGSQTCSQGGEKADRHLRHYLLTLVGPSRRA